MNDGIFQSREVAILVNCSYGQLLNLIKKGLIAPKVAPLGKGDSYRFSWDEVLETKVITRLRSMGVSLQKIVQARDYLKTWFGEKTLFSDKRILIFQGDLYFYKSPMEAETAKTILITGQCVGQIVIPKILDLSTVEKDCYNVCVACGMSDKLERQIKIAS